MPAPEVKEKSPEFRKSVCSDSRGHGSKLPAARIPPRDSDPENWNKRITGLSAQEGAPLASGVPKRNTELHLTTGAYTTLQRGEAIPDDRNGATVLTGLTGIELSNILADNIAKDAKVTPDHTTKQLVNLGKT